MRNRLKTIRALPFDFDLLKSHLHIEHDLDDVYINQLAWAAIEHCEQYTGRTFAPETYEKVLPYFCDEIELEFGPITDVEPIDYYDVENEPQTFDDYYLVGNTLVLSAEEEYPATYNRPDAVTITYHAGAEAIPPSVKQAAFFLVAAWNENREGEITGTISTQLALGIDRLLQPWRINPYA